MAIRNVSERLIGTWLLIACVPLAVQIDADIDKTLLTGADNIAALTATAVVFGLLTLLTFLLRKSGYQTQKIDTGLMVTAAVVYAGLAGYNCRDSSVTSLACALIIAVCITYGYERGLFRFRRDTGKRTAVATLTVFAVLLAAVIGVIGVFRYLCFLSPSYDFGIFAQMFHNMKESFLPMTTCERDRLLSHFAVHISPVFYLILPVYYLFPYAATLQLAQAGIVAAGVFPLYLLCRKKLLPRRASLVLCAVYCLYPALSGGTTYDIHENCFLTVFLLFTFYFYESEKPLPMYLFALLTLGVKEDAAVYIAFFAIYVMLSKKKWKRGGILLGGAVAYFAFAVFMLKTYGEGAMNYRYTEYITNDSLVEMVLNVVCNPGLVLRNAFTAEKFAYLVQMFLPLCFLPLLTKKLPRFVLLCPMLLINLMSDYQYQYHIGYQYSFGTVAFLFYLAVLNLSDMPEGRRVKTLLPALAVSIMMFADFPLTKLLDTTQNYADNSQNFQMMEEMLDEIPKDASVIADGSLLPHLYDRAELYEFAYTDKDADYVAIDCRESSVLGGDNKAESVERIEKCFLYGYRIYRYEPDMIVIFMRDE